MALRILFQFGILFAIGVCLGAAEFVGAPRQSTKEELSLQVHNPHDVVVAKGHSAQFECDATSTFNDRLNVTWYHNGTPLNSSTPPYAINGTHLTIEKVAMSGKRKNVVLGEYTCLVRNIKGAILSSAAKLRTASIDRQFTAEPENTTAHQMQPVVLHCSVHSTPQADIEWEYNNSPLPQNERYVPLFTGSLLITNVERSDSGMYKCIATNSILKKGKASRTAHLTVLQDEVDGSVPTFLPLLEMENNRTVLVGEQLRLYCPVNGWPTPQLQWLNNDSVVISNKTVLTLHNVSLSDSGNYTCTAYNKLGHTSRVYTVNVHQAPYFNVTPSSEVYPPAKTARLECQALGVPEPKIYWLKDGKPLSIKGRIKKHPLGLVFSHTFTSDSGIYQCVAVNSVGRIWTAAEIIMKNSVGPKPPEDVHCRPYDESSICLTWRFQGANESNDAVKAYTSYSFYNDGEKEVAGPDYLTNTTYQLADELIPHTNYSFYIRSYSSAASDSSERVFCRTATIGARNLEISMINESSVALRWSEVSWDVPCNGTQRNYTIQWQRTDGRRINGRSFQFSQQLKAVVNGLLSGVEYKIRIYSASYEREQSDWAIIKMPGVEITTPETDFESAANIEGVTGSATSSTSIQLQWNNRDNAYSYFVVCFNRIVYIGAIEEDCKKRNTIKTVGNSVEVNKLKPGTEYKFVVRGFREGDMDGSISRSITIATDQDVPSPAIGLEYKILNSSSVCLRWQRPLYTNGRLISYLIQYTPDRNWMLDRWLNVTVAADTREGCWPGNDEQVSTILIDLSVKRTYLVLVRAESNVGIGNPTVPIQVSTNPAFIGVNKDYKEQAPDYVQNDVNLKKRIGIYIGLSLSIVCVMCCLTCTIVRKRCLKRRALLRARLAASNNYNPAVAHYAQHGASVQVRIEDPCTAEVHEIEHLVASTEQQHIPPIAATHLDTKGGDTFPNGHINGVSKTYTNGNIPNGNVVHITENPQYKVYECNGHVKRKQKPEYEEDSNSNVKSTKFYDFYHLFDKTKRLQNAENCTKYKNGDLVPNNNSSSTESLNCDSTMNGTQLTCLDDSLVAPLSTNHRRVSPILGPNG